MAKVNAQTQGLVLLGKHPIRNVIAGGFLMGLVTIAVIAVIYVFDELSAYLFAMLLGLLWMVLGAALLGQMIAAMRNSKFYSSAKKMILNGAISPCYVGRNPICNGLVMVDCSSQKIFINGAIHEFSSLKTINIHRQKNNPNIEFVFKSGANPISRVYFATEDQTVNFFERFGNDLGWD